jgi:phage shock protein C
MGTQKRLYRSTSNRQIAGVCGGLADYFNVDVSLIRLLFIIMTVLSGPGFLLYIVLWLVIPEDDGSQDYVQWDEKPKHKNDGLAVDEYYDVPDIIDADGSTYDDFV